MLKIIHGERAVWRSQNVTAPRNNGSRQSAKTYSNTSQFVSESAERCWSRRQIAFGAVIACGFGVSFIAGVAVSVGTTRVEAGPVEQTVIRANKGDRLRWLPASYPKKQSPDVEIPALPAEEDLKLPDGCDSSISPIANARAARVARYCVS
jgi:hypothetical protein